MVEVLLHRVFSLKYAKYAQLKVLKHELREFLRLGERIEFPKVNSPKVSIIVPVYNGAHHTLRCLRALSFDRSVPFEVIVFDDGSTDETSLLLQCFENLVVARSEQNFGSIKAINTAAKMAKGQFLLLLNNDATLISGSIADAVSVFHDEKDVGAVGARIVQADGLLQEAGCIIFQDGTTNGYLRFCQSEDPRAMFMREVDYCSAIFLLVRTELFLELDGFDEIYAPAYFEETDFCMKLRTRGLRMIYDPSILVEHFEFGSHQSASGRKLIAERKPIFLKRWEKQLGKEGFDVLENANSALSNATRLVPRPRVLLVLDEGSPLNFSASVGELVRTCLLRDWQITFFVPKLSPYPWQDLYKLFGKSIEVTFGSSVGSLEAFLRKRTSYFDLCIAYGNKAKDLTRNADTKQVFKKCRVEFLEASQKALVERISGG
jgi:O-antigen biosynthesis protein